MDGDEVGDGHEINVYGTDAFNADSDADGLTDGEELFTTGTDALFWDSDGDDVSDFEEVSDYGTDPLNIDTDGDRLYDGDELWVRGTDVFNPDTDGDKYGDGDEVLDHSTDPLDPASYPGAVTVNGHTAGTVEHSSGGFYYMGGSEWVEQSPDGTFTFTEVGRDEWSVYLQASDGRDVAIQLDLWTREIWYTGPNGEHFVLYTITDAS